MCYEVEVNSCWKEDNGALPNYIGIFCFQLNFLEKEIKYKGKSSESHHLYFNI